MHNSKPKRMNPSFVTSILTISLLLFIVFVSYLHQNRFLTSIVKVFVKNSPEKSVDEEICKANPVADQVDLVTKGQDQVQPVVAAPVNKKDKSKSDPFRAGRAPSYPTPALCSKFNRCEKIPLENTSKNLSTIFKEYKEDFNPRAFSLIDRNHSWNAFEWDLWQFTQVHWPVLDHVLEVERTHSIPSNPQRKGSRDSIDDTVGVFLVAEQNFDANSEVHSEGSRLFSPDLTFPDEFQRYSIHSNVFFWDFLNELLPNRTIILDPNTNAPPLAPNVCRYYSTNYRVFEGLTQVTRQSFFS